ncbi:MULTISPECIES: S24 family peptidase [Acinetobacter]|uniref:Peptidase S24-like protein n=2 Tax=Acinetobacter radioresistens TaxID=40216 RepID=A0ABP2GK12_ACIRA|nr:MULTISPECIES: S24 family peptidase [Acinetobacter]EEY87452.1 peptidase S24-like protein [Acinetobacter radioresistens SH164]EET82092.1 peptidase S24-like protein [Acinetobacter radioresistens SK82]EXE54392.1 helix-turn-helix family protein [Acinetobacter sp. 1239920]MCK4096575.1 helix-turn-helix transcriptional regulator [Acinetobacter radioresistens]MCK4100530.1 helix-turn-helix transcriptional regulator [Acinetobacter radioresistens]
MSNVSERILLRMKQLNLQQVDLIAATESSKGTVSKWISGVNMPSGKSIIPLAKALKTTPEWILTGEGPPLLKDQTLQEVSTWDESTPINKDEIEIPFFQNFSFDCGSGSVGEALKAQSQVLRISKATLRDLGIEKENAVATGASGDSMKPTIKDGDTIYLDLGRKTIKDGKIFAICHGGLFVAKRLYNLPMGGVRIVSDNTAEYPEVLLNAEERKEQEFEIVGWVWRITSTDNW